MKRLGFALFSALFTWILLSPAQAQSDSGCPGLSDEPYYAASFQLSDGGGEPRKLRLLIGKAKTESGLVAQIRSGDSCQATCQVLGLETEGGLKLECRAPQLGVFTSPVLVLWKKGTESSIRLGTWLQGYESAPLQVEVDRTALSGLEMRKLAQRDSHSAVETPER